jgi:hypothetical protein
MDMEPLCGRSVAQGVHCLAERLGFSHSPPACDRALPGRFAPPERFWADDAPLGNWSDTGATGQIPQMGFGTKGWNGSSRPGPSREFKRYTPTGSGSSSAV